MDFRKILFLMTNTEHLGNTGLRTGAYLSEITHAYNEFFEAGYEIVMASPFGGSIPLDGVKMDDPLNVIWVNDEEFMGKLQHTLPLSLVDAHDFDGVYIPGGHGAAFDLPFDRETQNIISEIYLNRGVVGAVCHGVGALINVKLADGNYLLQGKEVSAFTDEEEFIVGMERVVPFLLQSKVLDRGALLKTGPPFAECVSASGRLITGQNPASALGVAQGMLEVLDLVKSGLRFSKKATPINRWSEDGRRL